MTRNSVGPHDIPEDTGPAGLVGWIGEDLLRALVLRLTLLVAVVAMIAGATIDDAPDALRAAAVVAGGAGILVVLSGPLAGWPRRRQWWTLAVVLPLCGVLLAVLLAR